MRVRIVLKRNFATQPIDIVRGEAIIYDDKMGVTVRGRHFQEVKKLNDKYEEYPLSNENADYFIPFSSIRYIQYIEEGSVANKIDKEANARKPLKMRKRNCVYEP